jgi:environmental stress-induced protein Ves
MSWKNGLGITKQIDIQPLNSTTTSTFSWRLSSAIVSGNNTFSSFPGYDRILIVLKGDGLILNKTIKMEPCMNPYYFSGEEPINCQVIGDENVIDYGIIFRRDHFKASLNILSFESSTTSNINFVHVKKGINYFTSVTGSFTLDKTLVSVGETMLFDLNEDETDSVVKIMSNEDVKLCHVHIYKL